MINAAKFKYLIAVGLCFSSFGLCHAQDDTQSQPLKNQAQANQTQTNQSASPIDEIIAFGQKRGGDAAMNAFLSGDYVAAEIEFQKNYESIRRSVNLERDAIELSRSQAAFNSDVTLVTNNGQSGGSGNATITNNNASNIRPSNAPGRDDENTLTSGRDLGVQLYMKGLSQIQLEKYDEAYESLSRSLNFNKTLYDAHLRLGLLDLRNGNEVAAQNHYASLQQLWKRCNNHCRHKVDMKQTLDTFSALLPES